MKTLVLGIGNTLLSDEGVGVHVLARLDAHGLPHDVELLDGGTLSFALAVPIQEAEALVVVDAANLQDSPGCVRVFEGEAMDAFLAHGRKFSVHEVGLADLRAMALLAGRWPRRRALVAIQPQLVDWGERPTPAVDAAIPQAAEAVLGLIQAWRHGH